MVKIAVAGCGRLARHVHLPVLARLPGVEVVAVIDPLSASRESAIEVCRRARPFVHLREVWDAVDTDAIVISAPPGLHADLAVEALQHGKHIYLEKPLASSLRDADLIVGAWKTPGQVAMMGFNYRFHRLMESARRLLSDGAVGKPLMVSTVFASSMVVKSDWRAERGSGGALLELGSHHVDLVHFLFRERVEAAFAQTSSMHGKQGTATMQLRLESGLLVSSSFSFGTVDQDRIEVFGERAMLRVDRYLSTDCEIIPVARQQLRLRQMAAAVSFVKRPGELLTKWRAPGNELSYRAAFEKFAEAVSSGVPVKPDLSDGYEALAVLTAAQQSSGSNSWVAIA